MTQKPINFSFFFEKIITTSVNFWNKGNFQGFQVWVKGKMKNLKTSETFTFLVKPSRKDIFLIKVIVLILRLYIFHTTKNWSERKLSELFRFSVLGMEQNWKLENLKNFCFFLRSYLKLLVFMSVWFLSFLNSWLTTTVKI